MNSDPCDAPVSFSVGQERVQNSPRHPDYSQGCGFSVSKSCPTLLSLNMPGFPVLHYLPEFAQVHPCTFRYTQA